MAVHVWDFLSCAFNFLMNDSSCKWATYCAGLLTFAFWMWTVRCNVSWLIAIEANEGRIPCGFCCVDGCRCLSTSSMMSWMEGFLLLLIQFSPLQSDADCSSTLKNFFSNCVSVNFFKSCSHSRRYSWRAVSYLLLWVLVKPAKAKLTSCSSE